MRLRLESYRDQISDDDQIGVEFRAEASRSVHADGLANVLVEVDAGFGLEVREDSAIRGEQNMGRESGT